MPIRVLPPLLVNQIAAGEVVERPANVVKELLENAIDAGATRIEVEIEGGGKELIRVTDDGGGIAEEELHLAIAPHATSKITELEDLSCIRSMGFRGEALASIASVSRLRIVSRPRDAASAAMLEAEGAHVEPVRPAAGAAGTTISVRNLFFNTPARRRFLRGDQAEGGRVAELVTSLALAHPSIAFRLIQDGRTTVDLPAGQDRLQRTTALLGEALTGELMVIGAAPTSAAASDAEALSPELGGEWLRVSGLAGRPAAARPNARNLRLYVNGRPIVDRVVSHAVRDAYRGVLDPTKFPLAVIFIDIDPQEVDVNVHPTKSEVRFRNSGVVHQAVQRTIRAALRAADLIPEITLGTPEAMPSSAWTTSGAPWARPRGGVPTRNAPWPDGPGFDSESQDGSASLGLGLGLGLGVDRTSARNPVLGGRVGHSTAPRNASGEVAPGWASMLGQTPSPAEIPAAPGSEAGLFRRGEGDPPQAEPVPMRLAPVAILQAHRKYLVLEDRDGLLLVDQHALHERVMYEAFHARLGAGPLESQRLLVPAPLAADRARLEAAEELDSVLRQLGFDFSQSGPEALLLHAAPTLLHSRGVDSVEFLRELLDRAVEGGLPPERDAALVEVLSMMACKAAVKAGDRLSSEELAELLRQRERIERSSACPHGRPTSLRIALKELDRWFGR